MCAISIAFHFYLLIILTLNIKQKQLLKLYLAFYLKKKKIQKPREMEISQSSVSLKRSWTLFSHLRGWLRNVKGYSRFWNVSRCTAFPSLKAEQEFHPTTPHGR